MLHTWIAIQLRFRPKTPWVTIRVSFQSCGWRTGIPLAALGLRGILAGNQRSHRGGWAPQTSLMATIFRRARTVQRNAQGVCGKAVDSLWRGGWWSDFRGGRGYKTHSG